MDEKKNKHAVHHSSGKDVWCTPKWLFDKLNAVWNFTLDAACMKETALCKKYYTPDDNSLIQDWSSETVWLNPPYSDLKPWMEKVEESYNAGTTIVILIPSRTDTKAFQLHAAKRCDCICFIKGRLIFIDPDNPDKKQDSAPFPSCIIVLDKNLTQEKIDCLKSLGLTMRNI